MIERYPHNVVLVSGSRNLTQPHQYKIMNFWLERSKPDIIIEGGANGADAYAKVWAGIHCVHCATVPAMWDCFDKAAGVFRNNAMLLLRPTILLAFPMPDSKGTRRMIESAKKEGASHTQTDMEIHVIEISKEP